MSEVNGLFFNVSRHSKVVMQTTLVIQLIDSFTGQPPLAEGLSVTIEGVIRQPVKKRGGFFVFTNLPYGCYEVTIQSGYYYQTSQVIETKEETTLTPFIISLFPRPSHRYASEATLLSVAVECADHRAVPNGSVTATIVTAECSIAKLAQAKVDAGEQQLQLAKASEIYIGDRFLFVDKQTKKAEYCSIVGHAQCMSTYQLKEKLTMSFTRGSMLLPTVTTMIDERGHATLLFRKYLTTTYEIELKIEVADKVIERTLTMTEGENKSLGKITL